MPAKRQRNTPVRNIISLDTPPLGGYSGHYGYTPLPLQTPYYPYGYPFPPQYVYPPPPPPPLRGYYYDQRLEETPPPPPNKLHDLLDNENVRLFYWDVRAPPAKFQYRPAPTERPMLITKEVLGEQAINSKVRDMRIQCDRYEWIIDIKRKKNDIITLDQVFQTIYDYLYMTLTESEWNELSAGEKRNAHISRGIRITHSPVGFDMDGRIRRVDVLGERTVFSGLRHEEATEEWIMILASRGRNT